MNGRLILLALASSGLLAACAREASGPLPAMQDIECALDGAAGFAPDCTMERAERDGQALLVIRHPDGGFRRFELGAGRGIVTADGFEAAEVIRAEGMVEVRVGADRYRLPFAEQ